MRLLWVLLFLVPAPHAQTVRLAIPLDRGGPVRAGLDARAVAEMTAVALTGVGHLAASQAGVSNWYVPVVIVGWGGYLGARAATEPRFLADLGLTGDEIDELLENGKIDRPDEPKGPNVVRPVHGSAVPKAGRKFGGEGPAPQGA